MRDDIKFMENRLKNLEKIENPSKEVLEEIEHLKVCLGLN